MVLRLTKYVVVGFVALVLLAAVGILIVQRVSDGPIEPMQGGPFTTGELIEAPVTDWSFGAGKSVEFELVGFGTSRVAGYIMLDGAAYMTCDLGFMWNRLAGQQRLILSLIYLFKRWHEDAVEDGRARLRIDGRIYNADFVKVDDPEIEARLRAKMEDLAREYFAPATLGPPPAEPPNDVWFFRIDSRV